jgi:two-component system, OmpR family, sensor kinase
MTIRLRLGLWYAATLVVLFAVVGGIVWYQYSRMVRDTVDQELAARADDIRSSMSTSSTSGPDTTDPAWRGIFGAVFDARGMLASSSLDTPPGMTVPALGHSTMRLGPGGAAFAVVAIDGPAGSTVVAGRALAAIDGGLADLARLMLVAACLATLAALAGGWWLAGRALHPVSVMVREAHAIEMGDLGQRLRVPAADDELGRLARTLNGMLDRVAETVRRERRFVATASHDLRTPIATLQAELELASVSGNDPVALLASIRAAHGDAIRLASLAADLLHLAEADESGRALLRRPVAIREVLDGLVARFAPVAALRAVHIRVDAPDVVVVVDRVRLEQAIGNLLGNAIRESDPGLDVDIRVDAQPIRATGDTLLVVDVLDRGPGVPAELRDRLFQPFGAGPSARDTRTGLGLATVAAAVHAHGGSVRYEDRPGGGAWFRIEVPVSGAEPPVPGAEPPPRPHGLPPRR